MPSKAYFRRKHCVLATNRNRDRTGNDQGTLFPVASLVGLTGHSCVAHNNSRRHLERRDPSALARLHSVSTARLDLAPFAVPTKFEHVSQMKINFPSRLRERQFVDSVSLTLRACAINTTFREEIYSRWYCIDRLSWHAFSECGPIPEEPTNSPRK